MSTMKIIRAIRRRRYCCRGKIGEMDILFNPSRQRRRILPLVDKVRRRLLASFRGLPLRKRPLSLGLKKIYFYAIRFKRTVAPSCYYEREAFIDTRGSAKTIERYLVHEGTHAILREITSAKIPQWLEEGLACLMADRKASPAASPKAFALNLMQLGRKKLNFWRGPAEACGRYTLSHYAVKYLADRWGLSCLLKVLLDLDRHTIDQALKRHTGLTEWDLDDRIHEKILRAVCPATVITTPSGRRSVVLVYDAKRHPEPGVWGRFSGVASMGAYLAARRTGVPIAVLPRTGPKLFAELKGYENFFIPRKHYRIVAKILAYFLRNPSEKLLGQLRLSRPIQG
ncbi:MAG: hypothetical protein A2Z34_05645 [Planctomycetes bacterium RBG_16_59_8]|nr:MAG: hypothetical protein A2Z34_05645 [Planctomycetes bacterium RBG_16_59_8]